MFKWFKDKVKLKIADYVRTNYQKVNSSEFELGDINYTFRCHLNAVQKVREGKSEKIYSCIAIDKEDSKILCVHFINQNTDGKYVDNTWGWMKQHYNYYLIKQIHESEQDTIWNVLQDTKKSLVEMHSNWLEKIVVKKEII